MRLIAELDCETIRAGNVQPALVRAEETRVLLAMILWYAIPVVIVVASLFVRSRSPRRKVLYSSVTLATLIIALVFAWTVDREEWGVWLFFVLPATLLTGVRLIVASVVASEDAGR
ncbi:hypothetical protein AB0392_17865 [Nonomuraea angiospora]|uniref:hypothetical protein n=1 Tax=Nonomuraea angiospora TaxID=46172 RepID=UPI00344D2BE8